MINPKDPIPRVEMRVSGRMISTAAMGEGPTVVFLHGNGTYSYAWRNILPYLAQQHRCLAPDLPGMGRSDRILPSGIYSFSNQVTQLDLFLETMEVGYPLILVGHELGAAMAIQLAQMRSGMVAGLVLIEGVFRVVNDSTFEPDVAALLRDLRGEEGERLVLADNAIIERYLPRLTMRQLIPEELEAYREPHRTAGEARRAMLSMIRQLPIRSQPGPIDDVMEQSRVWCSRSKLPKLVIGGSPGFLTPAAVLGTVARWANASHASVRGLHYLMEDSPARIARTILDWVGELEGV